jgi:heptosyltransferase-2
MKALVIETAFLGDAIIALSLASEFKRLVPVSHITYLVRPDAARIIGASPDVDHVITFDKRGSESGMAGIKAKADELYAEGFDSVFLLHSSRRSQMLASRLNAPVKVGFNGMDRAGLTHTVADTGWSTRYERAILPLRALVPEASLSALPRITCEVPAYVTKFCNCFSTIIALAPGSAWATKKWGDEKFAQLAKRLTEQGFGVIVLGGEDARSASELIRASCHTDGVLDMTGRASLEESAGAISHSALLVSNDSAPAHLAVAVGTRVLTIFGPTVPAFGFAPPPAAGEAIELEGLWCRPCASHGSNRCPVYTHECMQRIGADEVFQRIEAALSITVASGLP